MNVYDVITGVDANGDEFTLPSLAQQWKDDMTKRIDILKKHGATSEDFRWRAPQEFIETGRWPADTPRPVTTPVSNDIPF